MPQRKNTKLRVAMLGHKRIPSREGGVEIVVSELATRMVALGHDVTCFNRGGHHVSGADFDEKALNEYKGVKLKQVFTVDLKGLAAMTSSFFAAVKLVWQSVFSIDVCALSNFSSQSLTASFFSL